ncbi:peptide ABC transporter substrate-binding protein [Paraclostridium bifermentans]|uniref:peptide ABC transporter substrate-binding protein n=2 Tax=Paraclostridium TaxID=1849822 RepID=UPI0027D45EE1|nr:peptide ABC transporter substrate-binding protein [Paraclostridium bifermentans]
MMKGVSYASNTGYKSDEYNKLVNEAKAMPEQNESWKKFAEAEKLMLEDAYIAPLIQSGMAYMQKEYVSDMFKFPTVPWSYKWADVDKEKKQLNLISTSDIPTIDPSKATDTVSFEVMTNTMEGLVRIDKENKAIPGIAESWETSEDGLTWTFKLRKDAKWSNGDEVTAKDFEYSWKRTLNPETASQYGFIMHDIVGAKEYNLGENKDPDSVGVKAIDDYTLEVKLVRPVTYFDKLMAFGVYLPQNQKFVESQGDTFGTTAKSTLYNGPFTLSEWKIEDHYSMTKNPTYWDNSAVKLDEINTKIVKDANSALNLYETDAIDRVGVTSENVDKYKDSKEFKTMKDSSTYFLQINAGNPQK